MIITKTPYRISFFGGGSDYPKWYRKYGGSVLSTTIDKHIYITCRFLPDFFKHKYRIVWSKIEMVNNINQIEHPAVKRMLKYLKINKGLEIHYDGDLPARSGMGSSSCFVVGLMKALYKIKKKNLSNSELSKKSIYFEQNIMREVVGSQDQVAASYGGFNKITFKNSGKIKIKKIKHSKNLKLLNKNLVLIYTGINRTAHQIAKSYVGKLTTTKKEYINKIKSYVNEGERIIKSGEIDDFGRLLNDAWKYKKKLSAQISNKKIDTLYNQAMKHGALGGKLLGAGGGGFLLMYMKNTAKKKFFKKFKNTINVPFGFSSAGSQIIFNSLKE
jgi:D-glycero-alpha-D-manno-heptose-7-phosphate kinase